MSTTTSNSVPDEPTIIQPTPTSTKYRHIVIEDETQNPSTLTISEKSMKRIADCSKMRIDKQLTKLAKDGVIFLKANNQLRVNAIKLRSIIIKLLTRYKFITKVPHPDLQQPHKSVEENGWIPKEAIKPVRSSLNAVFVGSIGINEPKWRSFWALTNDDQETQNHKSNNVRDHSHCIAPESQSSLLLPPIVTTSNDTSSNSVKSMIIFSAKICTINTNKNKTKKKHRTNM